jgi:putative restriction endonuclease
VPWQFNNFGGVANKFITIGSKGVSIPTQLTEIQAPLTIGPNHLRWANPGRVEQAREAHGWVSMNGEPFEIYPLAQAVAEGRVRQFEGAAWTVKGKRYTGNVFLPAEWQQGDSMPMYVGALAKDWPHGRVEKKLIGDGRNRDVVGIVEVPGPNHPTATVRTQRRNWTHDELLVGLNLYHKLTFGQLHARQPAIVALAEKLERGSNSVAMKLCNFASLDPALKLRNIKGLEGASALDRTVWNEFHDNLNEAVPVSEEALRKLFEVDESSELEVLPREGVRVRKGPPTGPTEMTVNVKLRRGQDYFRNAVLNNFGGRCGVTQLAVRELLIASHILPWGTHVAERLNVRNGLSLSRLHDAAFDRGLITFDDTLRLVISPRLKGELAQRSVAENFGAYAGQPLCLPDDAVLPDLAFLAEHRNNFCKA